MNSEGLRDIEDQSNGFWFSFVIIEIKCISFILLQWT